MKTVKIKDEDIQTIIDLDKKYKEFTIEFGMLHIEILTLEEKLKDLKVAEEKYKKKYIDLQGAELNISELIKNNYGVGELNLETGILSIKE